MKIHFFIRNRGKRIFLSYLKMPLKKYVVFHRNEKLSDFSWRSKGVPFFCLKIYFSWIFFLFKILFFLNFSIFCFYIIITKSLKKNLRLFSLTSRFTIGHFYANWSTFSCKIWMVEIEQGYHLTQRATQII